MLPLIAEQPRTRATTSLAVRLHRRPVWAVAAALAVVLLAFANEYGYHPDEMYFRMLGEHGLEWGYVDQPPLLPLLVRVCTLVLGDSLWAIRVPGALSAAVIVVLGASIAAELGGRRRAQVMTAAGVATSAMVLGFGHWILTSTIDTVAWCAVLLFMLRAVLRRDGRWWLAAGTTVGVALYAKFIILLLPASLLAGLLLVGPRSVFRDRRLYQGMALALVIGSPNLIYQIAHDFPQIQMAQGLAQADGSINRQVFFINLIFLFGPSQAFFWVTGLIKVFREPHWRLVRALGAGYLVATVAALGIEGGRSDYTGGFLIGLFAAGCVIAERWTAHRRGRLALVAGGLTVGGALQVVLALPLVPERNLADFQYFSLSLESVGWPQVVRQVTDVHQTLPEAERDRAVILTENFGEAGALDKFGPRSLPPVYSGHNQLYAWGPPPESADVVVTVGIDPALLRRVFRSCSVVAEIDNGLGVTNPEQGKKINICREPSGPWEEIWPEFRHYNGYM
ncbi:glycosyltransferase family 39 protein [Streptomyces sp. NPDC052042]|uniref:glycosyltransferase family 39 protein n=1 Tax=Streptomyces sp. NPDC052042 TaxID=3365683 RepID=UPI0037D8FE4D